MSDRYYTAEVNREILQEYLDLSHTPRTEHGAVVIKVRKEEIRQHIAWEVLSAYADEHAPKEPDLEIVK